MGSIKEIKFIDTALKLLIEGHEFRVDVGEVKFVEAAGAVKSIVERLEADEGTGDEEISKQASDYLDTVLGKGACEKISGAGKINHIKMIGLAVSVMREIGLHRQRVLQVAFLGASFEGKVEEVFSKRDLASEQLDGVTRQ